MTYTELKIRLMQQGAQFTAAAREKMCRSAFGQITFYDYATTGGVVIVLDGKVYANVPVRFQRTAFRIDYGGNGFLLYDQGELVPVSLDIIPAPRFALDALTLGDGTPVRELVMTHADRVRISPVHGCSFHCSYCTCNTSGYREISCEQLDAAFRIALADPYNRPRHALISGGTPRETAESYQWINHIYRFFPRKYPQMDFDVMLSPRTLYPGQNADEGYDSFLHFLREECGIKTMSVNLELYNESQRQRYIPEKAAVGMNHYEHFIRLAVHIFGAGAIRSSLVVGLEPVEDTLAGVQKLTEWGCIPVLSAFVPAPGTDGATFPAPGVAFLMEVVKAAAKIAARSHMQLGPLCRPCTHNSITLEDQQIPMHVKM